MRDVLVLQFAGHCNLTRPVTVGGRRSLVCLVSVVFLLSQLSDCEQVGS